MVGERAALRPGLLRMGREWSLASVSERRELLLMKSRGRQSRFKSHTRECSATVNLVVAWAIPAKEWTVASIMHEASAQASECSLALQDGFMMDSWWRATLQLVRPCGIRLLTQPARSSLSPASLLIFTSNDHQYEHTRIPHLRIRRLDAVGRVSGTFSTERPTCNIRMLGRQQARHASEPSEPHSQDHARRTTAWLSSLPRPTE